MGRGKDGGICDGAARYACSTPAPPLRQARPPEMIAVQGTVLVMLFLMFIERSGDLPPPPTRIQILSARVCLALAQRKNALDALRAGVTRPSPWFLRRVAEYENEQAARWRRVARHEGLRLESCAAEDMRRVVLCSFDDEGKPAFCDTPEMNELRGHLQPGIPDDQ